MTTIDTQAGNGGHGTPVGAADDSRPLHQRYKQASHYRSKEEEFDACKLGMWLFLTTEVLLFAGIFCAYAIFRMFYPQAFSNGSAHLDWKVGSINTVVLLISSYTMATAIHNAQLNQQAKLKFNLLVTIACGLAFVFIKVVFEYIPKWSGYFLAIDPALSHHEKSGITAWGGLFQFVEGYGGKRPGKWFDYPFAQDPHEPMWWSIYYSGTAIHALHVVIGASLIFYVYLKARKGFYGPKHYTGVEVIGLYWHLVDLIWIFLFPLLYLVH